MTQMAQIVKNYPVRLVHFIKSSCMTVLQLKIKLWMNEMSTGKTGNKNHLLATLIYWRWCGLEVRVLVSLLPVGILTSFCSVYNICLLFTMSAISTVVLNTLTLQ